MKTCGNSLPTASTSLGCVPLVCRLQGHKASVLGTQLSAGLQHGDTGVGRHQEPVQPGHQHHSACFPPRAQGGSDGERPPASPSRPLAGEPMSPTFRTHSPREACDRTLPVFPTGDVLVLLGCRPAALYATTPAPSAASTRAALQPERPVQSSSRCLAHRFPRKPRAARTLRSLARDQPRVSLQWPHSACCAPLREPRV